MLLSYIIKIKKEKKNFPFGLQKNNADQFTILIDWFSDCQNCFSQSHLFDEWFDTRGKGKKTYYLSF